MALLLKPLSRLDPEVIKGNYMMSKDKRTHIKSFSLRIHQPPATVREALMRTDILSSFRVSVLQVRMSLLVKSLNVVVISFDTII